MALQDVLNELNAITIEPSPDDVQAMRDLIVLVDNLLKQAEKAKRAGIEIDSQIANLNDVRNKIQQMIRVYG